MVQGTTTNTYLWDAADRLVAMEKNVDGTIASRTEFAYDGLGHRILIAEKDGTGATIDFKQFVWCGSELCQERDAAGNVTKEFYPQGMRKGINDVLLHSRSSGIDSRNG